jgi:hypothetical protein
MHRVHRSAGPICNAVLTVHDAHSARALQQSCLPALLLTAILLSPETPSSLEIQVSPEVVLLHKIPLTLPPPLSRAFALLTNIQVRLGFEWKGRSVPAAELALTFWGFILIHFR